MSAERATTPRGDITPLLTALAERAAKREPDAEVWRWFASAICRLVTDVEHAIVARRRGIAVHPGLWGGERALLEAIAATDDPAALRAWAVELLAVFRAAPSWGKPGEGFGEACELFAVDLPELKKKAEAEQKAEEKAKAAEADTTKKKGGK